MTTTTTTTGTLIDGVVKLDEAVNVPNNSRVSVRIELISVDQEDAKAALCSLLKRSDDHPIHSGGVRFTRDELHERD